MIMMLFWGCAKPQSAPLPSPRVEPDVERPAGVDGLISAFGARHPNDLPDAGQLRTLGAPESLHWVALEGETLQLKSLSLRALAGFPSAKTDEVCLTSFPDGHAKLKAASLVCMTSSSSDVRSLFETHVSDSDGRVSDAAKAGFEQRGWPVPGAEEPIEE